jgi:hypothetical protein
MSLQPSSLAIPSRSQESDAELDAYNAAFHELDLDWHWDAEVWAELRPIAGERERVCAYLRGWHPHLLKAYDAEFLGDAILDIQLRKAAEGPGRVMWGDSEH